MEIEAIEIVGVIGSTAFKITGFQEDRLLSAKKICVVKVSSVNNSCYLFLK
jgi:hypothetical protein